MEQYPRIDFAFMCRSASIVGQYAEFIGVYVQLYYKL
jgi:hypothetical protein